MLAVLTTATKADPDHSTCKSDERRDRQQRSSRHFEAPEQQLSLHLVCILEDNNHSQNRNYHQYAQAYFLVETLASNLFVSHENALPQMCKI